MDPPYPIVTPYYFTWPSTMKSTTFFRSCIWRPRKVTLTHIRSYIHTPCLTCTFIYALAYTGKRNSKLESRLRIDKLGLGLTDHHISKRNRAQLRTDLLIHIHTTHSQTRSESRCSSAGTQTGWDSDNDSLPDLVPASQAGSDWDATGSDEERARHAVSE